MKTILTAIFVTIFYSFSFAISFSQAAAENKIDYQIHKNDHGIHYHSPLKISVKNTSNQALDLVLDNGSILEPTDASFQNFIVTKQLLARLKPNEKKEIELFAMCIEETDMAPNEDAQYKFSSLKKDELKQLTQFIEKHEAFNTNSQFIVWQMIENENLYAGVNDFEINSFGDIEWIRKNENGDIISENTETENIPTYEGPVLTVSGSFTFNLSSSKVVHIAMFNDRNVVVKELYASAEMSPGKNEVEYSFNSNEYPEDIYYIKLVVNGKEFKNSPVDMNIFRN